MFRNCNRGWCDRFVGGPGEGVGDMGPTPPWTNLQLSELGAGSEGCSRCLCGKEAAPSASKPGVCPVHWAQTPEKRSTSKQTNKQTNRAWWCQHMGILAVPGLGRTLDLLQVIWELINQPECGQNLETNGGETAT